MSKKRTGDERLGQKLRSLRKAQGLTLRDVEAKTGVSNPGLSQIESGLVMPTVKTMAMLCALYGASLDDLCAHLGEVAKL